ncbi:MAG: radical SAM protein, partial [Rhodospirillales bacterium]|nr:radical SAM protein [Rhodospirillales bacterium]
MRVLLINPPYFAVYRGFQKAARVGVNFPTMGLLYLAGKLDADGHDVKLMDIEIEDIGPEEVCQRVRDFDPQLVGITAVTPTFCKALDIAKNIKAVTDVPIVLGGIHFTTIGEPILRDHHEFDFGAIGEGEITLSELAKCIKTGGDPAEVKGIIYRKDDGEVVRTAPRPLLMDLDELPFPARHLINPNNYLWVPPGKGATPLATLLTKRGCPYFCSFCAQDQIFTRKVRYRSVQNVLDELHEIVNVHGYNHISVSDDTLVIKRKRMMELCAGIKERGLKFTWEGMTRANLVDPELLRTQHEAGLSRMSLGVESGNQDILDGVDKGTTLQQVRDGYKMTKEAGIETRGSAIIGHPNETKKTAWETVKFLRSLKHLDQAYLNVMVPYPGTKVWEQAIKGEAGFRLLSDNYEDYVRYETPVLEVNDLDAKYLSRLQKIGLLLFYLTPRRIWYNVVVRAGIREGLRMAWLFMGATIKRNDNPAGPAFNRTDPEAVANGCT